MIQYESFDNETPLSCPQHLGQPICKFALDQKLLIQQRVLCSLCLDKLDQNQQTIEIQKALEILESKRIETPNQIKDFIKLYMSDLEKLQSKICELQQNINFQLDKMKQITVQWVQEVKTINNNNQLYQIIKDLDNHIYKDNNQNKNDSNSIIIELHEITVQQSSQLNIYLEQFSKFQDSQDCRQKIEKMIDIEQMCLQDSKLEGQKEIDEQFKYEIITQYSIKQQEYCHAIAINQQNTLVLIGCEKEIRVFEFDQDKMNQIQTLQGHSDSIFTLDFFKKQQNSFVSGSRDDSIMIWQYQNQQIHQWICQQVLKGHTSSILCLIYNQKEDLLISGSDDKTIKFWTNHINDQRTEDNQQQFWYCAQTITKHKSYVYGLSLNEQQTQLISCGLDKFILVMELLKTTYANIWMVVQKVSIENSGYRLCFLDNYQFAFQPISSSKMEIYEVSTTSNGKFVKGKEVNVEGYCQSCDNLFPSKFSHSKDLLIVKNGQNINIIKCRQFLNGKTDNERQFLLEQVIKYNDNCIYGTVSENGQYLITWDYSTKEIQLRKYQSQQ